MQHAFKATWNFHIPLCSTNKKEYGNFHILFIVQNRVFQKGALLNLFFICITFEKISCYRYIFVYQIGNRQGNYFWPRMTLRMQMSNHIVLAQNMLYFCIFTESDKIDLWVMVLIVAGAVVFVLLLIIAVLIVSNYKLKTIIQWRCHLEFSL